MLAPVLGREPFGLTDENLQSRLRGVLLMAVSNAKGWIVLTTGNKSEMATGYSTLYGDSAGGFAVIKDVPKTLVYDLCRYRNTQAVLEGLPGPIPDSVLDKPPSAELRPDQRDDQSLPPYEELDPVLAGLRRGRPHGGRPRGGGLRPGRGRPGRAPRRRRRVQAPPDAARACASRPRRSARTGACPSPTATAPRPSRSPGVAERCRGRRRGAWRGIDELAEPGRRLLLGRAPDLRADRGAGRRRRRRPAAALEPELRVWCAARVPAPRRCWPAAGPSGSRCGPASTGPPWSAAPAGPLAGALDALAAEPDAAGRRGGAGRDGPPPAARRSTAPTWQTATPGQRGARSWRSWRRPTGTWRGEIRGGRPLLEGSAERLDAGRRARATHSNGRLTKPAFSLLYAHLDSAITLSGQPTCARNGRRLRCQRARQPGQVPLPRPWDGRFGDDLGQGTN